jgi:hypothetical protein
MKSRDFCYWLQGVLEGGKVKSLDEEQVNIIRSHLNMVFIHEIDPSFPAQQREPLQQAHDEGKRKNRFNYPPGMKC